MRPLRALEQDALAGGDRRAAGDRRCLHDTAPARSRPGSAVVGDPHRMAESARRRGCVSSLSRRCERASAGGPPDRARRGRRRGRRRADLGLVGRADAAAGGADLARARAQPRAPGRARACAGRITCARFGDEQAPVDATPAWRRLSSSSKKASGSTTMPLPSTHCMPGWRMPDGMRRREKCRSPKLDRVAGVVAALVAHDDVEGRAEEIDDLPLPLVPPLHADDDEIGHGELAAVLFAAGELFAEYRGPHPAGGRRDSNRPRLRTARRPYPGARIRSTSQAP